MTDFINLTIMRHNISYLLLSATVLAAACNGGGYSGQEPSEDAGTQFAKGADISWVTEMEQDGIVFRNSDGEAMECTALMQSLGCDAIRLRVWVDPQEGWCGMEDVLVKARRAHELGMRLMIDFHYSDWWADPQQQNKPAAWEDMAPGQLRDAVTGHTTEVLSALKEEGITPEWVQVGNETSNGMLWDEGKADINMAGYAALTNAGYDAVKSVFPEASVIVHLHHGDNPSLYKWIFDGLSQYGGKWDMIGMSVYPEYYVEGDYTDGAYAGVVTNTVNNMSALYSKYGTPIMICEAGMSWNKPDESYLFLSDLISRSRALGDGICAGIFYWEPQCNPAWTSSIYQELGWSSYDKGAFDAEFKPTRAMEAFKDEIK